MSTTLYTAGYEERSIEEFIDRLKQKHIKILIDVREIAASRRPGFSKKSLKGHLEKEDIYYIHIKELGSPKELRDKLKNDKNFEYFFKEYEKYLTSNLDILKDLYNNTIQTAKSCIMCFERQSFHCHRKVVAEKIKEIDGNGLQIVHI